MFLKFLLSCTSTIYKRHKYLFYMPKAMHDFFYSIAFTYSLRSVRQEAILVFVSFGPPSFLPLLANMLNTLSMYIPMELNEINIGHKKNKSSHLRFRSLWFPLTLLTRSKLIKICFNRTCHAPNNLLKSNLRSDDFDLSSMIPWLCGFLFQNNPLY